MNRLLVVLAVVATLGAAGCRDDGSSVAGEQAVDTPTTTAPGAVPSPGCAAPDAAFAGVGDEGRIDSGGTAREFSLSVPATHGPDTPVPLVVDMHGARSLREEHAALSGFAELGRDEGFIVLTPEALGRDRPVWSLNNEEKDIPYLELLVDTALEKLCVDTSRVYLGGFSMGGMMSMVLACRHPERYAAIASVAGVADVDPCNGRVPGSSPPVPLIAFHGTADTAVRFDGTYPPMLEFVLGGPEGRDRRAIADDWATTNGCSQPTESPLPPDVERVTYECPADGDVVFYVVEGAGHTWPGSTPGPYSEALGGKTTQTIDATDLIWDFFQQHARPRAPAEGG